MKKIILLIISIISIYTNNIYSYNVNDLVLSSTITNITSSQCNFGLNSKGSIAFSKNGTFFFCSRQNSQNQVYKFYLTTPFDLSTATLVETSALFGLNYNMGDLLFSDNGYKLYIMQKDTSSGYIGKVFEYALSAPYVLTGWNLINTITSSSDQKYTGMDFNNNGTKFFLHIYELSPLSSRVAVYTLSTPRTLSSKGSPIYYTFDSSINQSIRFSDEGNNFFIFDISANLKNYTLTTPFDLSTASLTNTSSFVLTNNTNRTILFVPGGGSTVYMINGLNGFKKYTNTVSSFPSLYTSYTQSGTITPIHHGFTFDFISSYTGGQLYFTVTGSSGTLTTGLYNYGDYINITDDYHPDFGEYTTNVYYIYNNNETFFVGNFDYSINKEGTELLSGIGLMTDTLVNGGISEFNEASSGNIGYIIIFLMGVYILYRFIYIIIFK